MLVVVEVAGIHQSHGMQVGSENVGIFVQGAVLDDILAFLMGVEKLACASVQIVNLDVERPTTHILVKTVDIGIRFGGLVYGPIAIMASQHLGQCRLSRTNIPCNSNVHKRSKFPYSFVTQKNIRF